METRQRLETWPVIDAEFEPTTPSPTAIPEETSPIAVEVKRRIPKPVQVASFIGGIIHG